MQDLRSTFSGMEKWTPLGLQERGQEERSITQGARRAWGVITASCSPGPTPRGEVGHVRARRPCPGAPSPAAHHIRRLWAAGGHGSGQRKGWVTRSHHLTLEFQKPGLKVQAYRMPGGEDTQQFLLAGLTRDLTDLTVAVVIHERAIQILFVSAVVFTTS